MLFSDLKLITEYQHEAEIQSQYFIEHAPKIARKIISYANKRNKSTEYSEKSIFVLATESETQKCFISIISGENIAFIYEDEIFEILDENEIELIMHYCVTSRYEIIVSEINAEPTLAIYNS
jgi:uncharacterized membrane protein YcjF (UPF0283 family)